MLGGDKDKRGPGSSSEVRQSGLSMARLLRSALAPTGGADSAVEKNIGHALLWGVTAAATLIAVGLADLLWSSGLGATTVSMSSLTSSEPAVWTFRSPAGMLSGLGGGDPNAIIGLGLLILIVTPVLPVFLSLVSFLRRRDLPFVLITLWVLAVLVAGLLWVR